MGVRKRGSAYYHYEFQYRGKTYRGVCEGCTTRQAALAFEKKVREQCVQLAAQRTPAALVENYKNHHDLQFYAARLHISTTYLSRIVKRLTGNTVRFHISELICAEARRQLECTDREIKEIAAELGFSDQSVFGKFFVAKTGLSPLRFRMSKTRGQTAK